MMNADRKAYQASELEQPNQRRMVSPWPLSRRQVSQIIVAGHELAQSLPNPRIFPNPFHGQVHGT